MLLIIAEKPSLARNIIDGIGKSRFEKSDGFYISNKYIVTWAFGHLFTLADIEEYLSDYDPREKIKWSLDNLPFFPDKFKLVLSKKNGTVDSGVKKQFMIIEKLCHRQDVDSIINAGDADREGEIIIRTIISKSAVNKPVYRLWLPDQTAETIRAGLNNIKPDTEYDNLANEGYARMYIDWLYGVNLTRYATLKSGTLLRIGRVVTPIVKAIYDRDTEIENFAPQKYYQPTSETQVNGEIVKLESKNKFSVSEKDKAQQLCDMYNNSAAVVKSVTKERKTISAGKLYSLSKLQGVLGKKHKMPPSETLSVVQSLYEKGYVTYPRTNTEYLAEAEKDKIQKILSVLKNSGYSVEFKDKKSIFDDTKIESHSALIPTMKIPTPDTLTEKENIVYYEILNRFLAVFCSLPCELDRTTITIAVGDYEEFILKGDVYISEGFLMYDKRETKNKILPPMNEGDILNISFFPKEKETTPPKPYTAETLNNYLKNPFRDEKKSTAEDEYKAVFDGLELGTEATRAGIIDGAIKSEYISLKNNVYHIEDKGRFLIQSAEKLNILMDKRKTAELGKSLKRVYRGEISVADSVRLAEQEISALMENSADAIIDTYSKTELIIGKCPKCGSDVIERKKGFCCSNKDCKFALWKDDKYFKAIGKKMTAAVAKSLLSSNKITFKGLKSKKGTTYSAVVNADFSGQYPNYTMVFPNKKH